MKPCEYFLVQYVPFPREDLRLSIGMILLEENGTWVRHAMTPDWKAVRCLDPSADLRVLNSLPGFLGQIVNEHPHSGPASKNDSLRLALLRMAESNLGKIQIAAPRGVETEDPEREFVRLFDEHIASRRATAVRPAPRQGSRRWIQSRLRQALERLRLGEGIRENVGVEEFTASGDGFRIDYSYRPNGVTKYLHALSLEHDWNQAKVLSYTFGKIRARIPAAMTAVVADANPSLPAAPSCRQILLDSEIAIQPLSDLESLVDQIQMELGPAS